MTTTDTARPTVLARLKHIFGIREMPVIVALIALIIITWVINPRFLTSQGVKDLFLNATIAMLMAAGQSLIISTH